jgi:hypothetical protein
LLSGGDTVQVDVLLVEPVKAIDLVIGPILTTPVILDTAEIGCDSAMYLPEQAFQNTIFRNIVLGIWRITDETAPVSVAAVSPCSKRPAPIDRTPDFTLCIDVFALILGFDPADSFWELANEVVNVLTQAVMNAFDSIPIIDVQAFVIE